MRNFYILCALFLISYASKAQIINFPDPNFKTKLLQPHVAVTETFEDIYIDTNGNGEIEVSEAQRVVLLDVSNANISDLTGISNFTSLKTLRCNNNALSVLNIDPAISLGGLNASHNALTSVNVSLGSLVEGFDLSYNLLTSFTIQSTQYYDMFDLSHNELTNLVIDNANFEYFNIGFNQLATIEVIGSAPVYQQAYFSNNNFSLLDLTDFDFDYQCWITLGNNTVDRVLFGSQPGNIYYSSNNAFFDLGNFSGSNDCDSDEMGNLHIADSPNLKYFTLKNGFNHTEITCNEGGTIFDNPKLLLNITNCPNLAFICVDELEKPNIQLSINRLGLQNQVEVNSYCTFAPGGTFYTINGKAKMDMDNNGCDITDSAFPNLKLNITEGTITGSFMTNATGNFSMPVSSGAHSITPQLENPAYFIINPPSFNVNFPTQTSPHTQDFCITANGTHPDLEIAMIPTTDARPGFDATYKLVYKNKGNTIQSGTANLNFDDAVLDFVSANPMVDSQSLNNLSWSFSNLRPFETREITVVLNANSPMEIPAVNDGDVLNYTVTITSGTTDEIPEDNTFSFNHIVVNSFDPNDKICLEGTTITPDMAGKYIHYKIRFENTGTANAENIVVKDIIDTTKFDISSLIPINASHAFETKISDTNKVEFIFQNINLPFDDANNDGYVVFKIKTKPTLVLGDSFSNSASIYFDYNFPIVTNTETTTFAVLETKDFEFSDYFSLYPNPANAILNIKSKKEIKISSVSIYNVLGQLVLVNTNLNQSKSIDVSALKSGNYFIKIQSDKGISHSKFIKQ